MQDPDMHQTTHSDNNGEVLQVHFIQVSAVVYQKIVKMLKEVFS